MCKKVITLSICVLLSFSVIISAIPSSAYSLFMPHLTPYLEVGYGIGTHIFDVGAFAGFVNGKYDGVGFKFTFELFNE